VLAHLTEGAGLREVAKRLHMSVKTINTHLHNLRGKLGVHSTLEAVALARFRSGRPPGQQPVEKPGQHLRRQPDSPI
jgi:transposase